MSAQQFDPTDNDEMTAPAVVDPAEQIGLFKLAVQEKDAKIASLTATNAAQAEIIMRARDLLREGKWISARDLLERGFIK